MHERKLRVCRGVCCSEAVADPIWTGLGDDQYSASGFWYGDGDIACMTKDHQELDIPVFLGGTYRTT